MSTTESFDVIVIGAGHAGCEAAWAAARMGNRVLLTTIDLRSVGYMACNPSIGGIGKSHLVYEIDALGGIMPTIADKTCIQMRTLNAASGPAVRALRAQIDKHDYHATMLKTLQSTPNLTIREIEAQEILTKGPHVSGVKFTDGTSVNAGSVVVAAGVYLSSCIMIGHTKIDSGPMGFAPASFLTASITALGHRVRRFKTGTPPRVTNGGIDYSQTTAQPPDTDAHFSFLSNEPTRNLVSCHLTYTNSRTHQIIRDNLQKSAMFGGIVKGIGARYCPSIEDKIVRFASAERHQVFLEPESLSTDEIYLQGISTSLPPEIQREFVQSIDGLQHAKIVKNAYAIEYDCIDSLDLRPTFESKLVGGLFFAGQVNGTSGYEEAAAQGILAGINAALSVGRKHPQLILSRTNSYIGVLADDLTTLGTNEPYRMFTSRAEHRLHLRRDNADQRLTPIGRKVGLVDDCRWHAFNEKLKQIEIYKNDANANVPDDVKIAVDSEKKYSGYLQRASAQIAETQKCEGLRVPADTDYRKIAGLRTEAVLKLEKVKPETIAQAMKISGVTPADINVLLVNLRKK